jgi:CarD family transcriptional regulator
VKLTVGELVVYAAYGVGRIAARTKSVIAGADQEIVVLEFARGLRVSLPLERALRQLRPPFNEAEMLRVQQTLREAGTLNSDVWLKRRKETQAKLKSGDPIELAEVVRDGAQRVRALAARPSKPHVAPAERELYLRARELLSQELRLVRGVEEAAADAWIEEQLGLAS